MDYAVIISAVVLGLSVLATAAKFLDWFLHTDPPTMVRVSRWMLLLLILAGIPILVWMIADGRWSAAMLLGAGLLAGATFLKWRAVLAPLRAMLGRLRPKARPFDMAMAPSPDADRETVRRAAAVLEAYVQRAALPAAPDDGMSRAEAFDVLGLAPGADEAAIRAVHRRLSSLVHPDHSGSTYFTRKVDEAKDTLLRPAREWPRLSNG
jgi:hypothetical protein